MKKSSIKNQSQAFKHYLKPRLYEMLHSVKIDVQYHKAEGNYLYYFDATQSEIKVLDLLGGYGANLLGHNHPRLVKTAISALQQKLPFNAQASIRGYASQLAEKLSELVRANTGKNYITNLSNSGAEAVEAALKHAELAFVNRLLKWKDIVIDHIEECKSKLRHHLISCDPHHFKEILNDLKADDLNNLDDLWFFIQEYNNHVFNQPPVFLAHQKGYHGKTLGALQITEKRDFRFIWDRNRYQSIFLSASDPTILQDAIEENRLYYLDLSINSKNEIEVIKIPFVNISACFIEPIQGEGGINIIDESYLKLLQSILKKENIPLIFDEIQSGLGRSGTFMASEPSHIVADYYLFSKSLGGGLVKIAATLIDSEHYQHEFSYIHSSTFADDDYSCLIALKTLEILTENQNKLIDQCRSRGEFFIKKLKALQKQYPSIIKEIRGRGLMIGIEFSQSIDSTSRLLNLIFEQHLLVYVLTGYLLNEAQIRVAPALSANMTLRIEPSAYITKKEMTYFIEKLAEFCQALLTGNVAKLTRYLMTDRPLLESFQPIINVEKPEIFIAHSTSSTTMSKIVFLGHPLQPYDLAKWDAGLHGFTSAELANLLQRCHHLIDPFLNSSHVIRSPLGQHVQLDVMGVFNTAKQMIDAFRSNQASDIVGKIKQAIEVACSNGANVIGFGGFTSIVTQNCLAIKKDQVCLTSGNSLTTIAAYESFLNALKKLQPSRRVLGIVGAMGNIGKALTELLSPHIEKIILFGRAGHQARLEKLAHSLVEISGTSIDVAISTNLIDLKKCNLIVSASNSPTPIIHANLLGKGPIIICDVAVPHDVDPSIVRQRDDVYLFQGGLTELPLQQKLEIPGMDVAGNKIYACLGETILLGLSGVTHLNSYGDLKIADLKYLDLLAKQHGFIFSENYVLP